MRLRWLPPYAFAVGALISVGIAVGTLGANMTEQDAPIVQCLMFGVAPLLSLMAVATATKARRGRAKATVLAALGIVAAAGAHVIWYSLVDEGLLPGAEIYRVLLLSLAVLLVGYSSEIALGERLDRSVPVAPGVRGIVLGAAVTFGLAIPLAGPSVALFALMVVVVLHRRGRRHATKRVTPGGLPRLR